VNVRHEGTPSQCTRLLTNSSVSLEARQARIDALIPALSENHIAAELEFFNMWQFRVQARRRNLSTER